MKHARRLSIAIALCLTTLLPSGLPAQVVSNIPDLVLRIDGLPLTDKQKQTLEGDLSLKKFNKQVQSLQRGHRLDSLAAFDLLGSSEIICPDPSTVAGETGSVATTAWQILPFPTDSDWPSWQGQPCLIEGGTIIFEGRSVRSQGSFAQPATVSMDIMLDQRQADDGYLQVQLLPAGQPIDVGTSNATILFMIYRNPGNPYGGDVLRIDQETGGGSQTVWGEVPFSVVAGTIYHLQITVASSGLTFNINGQTYTTGLVVPYATFQIQLQGWQPTNRWFVNNISVK